MLCADPANPSPYAGCTSLDESQVQAGSLNYLNSEVEPQVSVDPTDPAHLVGAWQQDRWSDGGAHGLVAGYSTDGGTSFLGDYQGLAAGASGFVPFYVRTNCADGGPSVEPSCRAVTSVLPPADPTPTGSNSTDVYARPGS